MATKRYTPLDDPPSASSDDDETEDEQEIITQKTIHESSSSSSSEDEEEEEEEEEEEFEEESEESEEETPKPKKNPQFQNPNSKISKLSYDPESGSDSEDEPIAVAKHSVNSSSIFEFESDLKSPTASDFAIKPSKKIKPFDSPENTPTSKRVSSGSEINNNKKKIKVSNGDIDDEKKAVIKRVWSVDDELLLLQGFIDYQLRTGCSPLSDMDGFYQFTMSSIPGHASKSQLYEKVRRLKKKFRVTSEKVNGNGGESVTLTPLFSKPHELKLFELSNKIWGVGGCESVSGGGSTAKVKVRVSKIKPKIEVKEKEKEKEKVEDEKKVVKVEDFETRYPYWNAGLVSEVSSALKFPDGVVTLVKENLSLIGEAKAKEMNEKWKVIFENEAVLRKRRIVLLSDVGDVETA